MSSLVFFCLFFFFFSLCCCHSLMMLRYFLYRTNTVNCLVDISYCSPPTRIFPSKFLYERLFLILLTSKSLSL